MTQIIKAETRSTDQGLIPLPDAFTSPAKSTCAGRAGDLPLADQGSRRASLACLGPGHSAATRVRAPGTASAEYVTDGLRTPGSPPPCLAVTRGRRTLERCLIIFTARLAPVTPIMKPFVIYIALLPPPGISNDLTLVYSPATAGDSRGLPITERERLRSLTGMKQLLAPCRPLT